VLAVFTKAQHQALVEALQSIAENDFVAERVMAALKEKAKAIGAKMPELAKPLRVLATGNLASPDLGLVCEALGKEKVLSRVQAHIT
jgi:glutamyl/glutaminyl-tRNA synthetase